MISIACVKQNHGMLPPKASAQSPDLNLRLKFATGSHAEPDLRIAFTWDTILFGDYSQCQS